MYMVFFAFIATLLSSSATARSDVEPQPWPLQFHALCVQHFQGELATIDLWYDWINGRNFNIIRNQLAPSATYDLEWTNGTSFFYNLQQRTCRTVHVPVGILRPDWLAGARYIGREDVNGFRCNVWEKADFITYYEDTVRKVPVRWVFYTGRVVDVMTFEEGAALPDNEWQAPVYCFDGGASNISFPGIRMPEDRWMHAAS